MHAFASHEDTEHRHHIDGLSFEIEHHHCGALSAFIAAFELPAQQAFCVSARVEKAPLLAAVVRSLQPRKVQASGLRGPPVG